MKTLLRKTGAPLATPSAATTSYSNNNNNNNNNNNTATTSPIQDLLGRWAQLDEDLSPFERLESMRQMVVQGDLGQASYAMLHHLAVHRATGRDSSTTSIHATGVFHFSQLALSFGVENCNNNNHDLLGN